jgi:beta-glucosidase
VTVELEPLFLSVFDTDHNSWQRVAGDYTFSVGGSSQELPLHASASLQ